ncbi:alpha-1-inhibitor 3-like [Spodoptera litura]|uniref:Alpha-1-inhibitor 3-like n=1 Tax=Spodoptera litura TaxID=69820 RepID=A0A9J7E7G8_SPOLT|nr:alpha-1-inhibitor 3-like [Spodoptera litura]
MTMWWLLLFILPLGLVSSSNNATEQPLNIIGNPCTDRNHMFLAPGVLTAGSMNRACISRFHTEGPARMTLNLMTEDRQTQTVSRELGAGDGGCLDINVPLLPNSKADLVVNIRYPDAQCVWERRVPLRISSGRVVVLSTERARYRPGETVRLRILALRQDLAPSHGNIEEVWLEGPRGAWEGSRVTQWQHVRTRLGLAQLQYQLDELAPTGKWMLRARLSDGSQGSSTFWVGNYELPPFQLSVRHAPKVLRTSDRLVWTVCVRYPWSEAVEGMLVIRLRGAGGGSGGIRTAVQLRAPKACHRHAAAAKRVGLDGTNPPDVVVADFSFQEEGTRIWQNTTVVSQVVDKPISLEFLTKHRAVIAPGLPYRLKVKATRWDDKPAAKELIRVCRHQSSFPDKLQQPIKKRETMCAEGTTDDTGVARLLFSAGDDASPFYRFEAHLSNDTSIVAAPLTLPVRRSASVHAALGPLKAESRQARTFVPLYLNTNNTSTPFTVHFVVITRGGIIYRWGATTQCPTSNSGDQIRTAARNSKCPDLVQRDVVMTQRDHPVTQTTQQTTQATNHKRQYRNTARMNPRTPRFQIPEQNMSLGNQDVLMKDTYTFNVSTDVSDALLDRHQLRVMLPIKVSHQMCPDSHLIAYFYHEGELVSASKHFEMEECFFNKVEATWLSRQAQPGSTVTLKVSTPGPALCALTVLDSAAKWTQPPQPPKEQLMNSLRRLIDSHRNLTEFDAAGVCFLNSDTLEIPSGSVDLTASWLAAAGVRLIGGDMPNNKHCIPRPPALLQAEETNTPRSDFSEAWLWRLLGISSNGTGTATANAPDSITKFEAGAICVSRNGVAISPPAVLQVFREFFIHADSPKRLRRGDSTIIRYRIFNYLYEPLSVQIQILTDPHVEGPKELVESACVKARSSIARRVEIRARVAAPARISIRAKAVSDGNCGNVTSGRTGVSDEVIIRIAVEPEGVPVREQKSILLCGNKTSEAGPSEVLWTWTPVKAVPGTETLTMWAVGDVTGPLLAEADSLLQIPRGCGEQNMAQLATNLLALSQLDPNSITATTAKEYVARGFTRQLQYVHPSGGFSAFGPSDATSSTWLTAFVVKHMRRAHKLLWPNLQVPTAIIRAERWLLNQQMENGCFRNEGQVFHRELKGGLNDEGEIANVALTAYVITALIESASPFPHRVIRNTLSCLRALPPMKSKTPTRVYANALLAYAYMKLDRYEEELRYTNEASLRRMVGGLEQDEGIKQVLNLMKMAKKNGQYVWWETSSLSTSVEATSYAVLSLAAARRLPAGARTLAAPAARWLNAHRSATGGFISTQDTLVALEALSAWSAQTVETNLNVTARCSRLDHRVTLQPGVKIPEVVKMRPGERLTVSVEGTGCALIQATRAYHVLSPDSAPRDQQLSVQVSVHTDGPFDCGRNRTSCYCAAVVEACVLWTGSFPEMALMEVTLPGGFGADAQLLYSQLGKTSSLLRRIELTPSNSRATFYLGTRDGSDTSDHVGHQCYNIHATGPRVKTRPAYARVQDYYVPAVNDTQVYTIPEECPPRIVHEANDYRTSDNLYSKARATNSDDIVITHEFSFEDIPEGIPLEDPLIYDHLTENENYRTPENQQEVGKLQFNDMNTQNDGQSQNVTDVRKPPENLKIGEPTEQVHSNFDNVVNGYFCENDATTISNINDIINTGIGKDNNFASTASGGVAKPEHYQPVSFGSAQSNNRNFENILSENLHTVADDSASNHEKADNTDSFLEKIDDITRLSEEIDTIHRQWHSGESYHHFPNTIKENTDTSNTTITVLHQNFNPPPDNQITQSVLSDAINRNLELVKGLNETLHYQSALDKKIIESLVSNKATEKDSSNENLMTIVDSEGDQQDGDLIDSDNISTELKNKAIKNNDESQFDTKNNLVHEIDTLNKIAHRQLNETRAKYDVHHIDYTQMYAQNSDMEFMSNKNYKNVVGNYYGPGSRDNEIKRSFTDHSPAAQAPEQIIYNSDEYKDQNEKVINNPSLTDFHVIDTDKDLEVPPGIEGPVAVSVLPPPGYVAPVVAGEARRLNYKRKPFEYANRDEVPQRRNFVPPRQSQPKVPKLSLDMDLSFGDDESGIFESLPVYPQALPSHGYRRMLSSYTGFPQYPVDRVIRTMVPPKRDVQDRNMKSVQSIYTPNGPYFYFKPDGEDTVEKFFVPVH